METILRLLPVLACPIMMGLLIWAMSRNNNTNATTTMTATDINAQRAHEPIGVTAASASPIRSVVNMLKCCLNPKVLAGLAVVGVGVLVFAPNLAAAALPLLIVLACPLSMLFMMRAMRGQMHGSTNGAAAACEHCAPQQEQAHQPVVIDQVPSPKSRKLPASAGETIGHAQASQERERERVLVANPSWDE